MLAPGVLDALKIVRPETEKLAKKPEKIGEHFASDLARPHRHDIVAGGPPHDSKSAAGAFTVSKAVPPQRTPRKTSPEGWQAARMPRQTYS